MKLFFQYQRYYLRTGLCGLFVVIWILVSRFVVEKITSPWLYWIASAVVTVAIMTAFYKKTDRASCFLKTGSFEKTEAGYILKLGRTRTFRDVQRLCAWKSSLYGTSFWVLQIEAEQKMKIISKPLKEEQAFEGVSFYAVYDEILKDHPELKQEKDADGIVIPYFYAR